jgi:thioredoxin reductase (NADPH)
MVTAEEIRTIKVFECLDETGCERLARVAADINLVPGEFAAEEGAERALFAVLDGRIEATRNVDGIDRVLGERLPGDVFGEVPISLGTFFPVGFRAA